MADSSNDDTWRDAIAFERGTNVLIENSIVEGAGGDGIDLKADRVAVVNSIVRHIGRNGVKLWNGGDLVNTLVFDTGADAQMVTEAGTYRIVNCTFAFHLKEGGRSYAATFAYDESASTDVTLTNNVFFAMPGELYFAPCASVHLDHNVFYGFPDAIVEWGSKEYGRSDLAAVFGESNLYVDPGFADPKPSTSILARAVSCWKREETDQTYPGLTSRGPPGGRLILWAPSSSWLSPTTAQRSPLPRRFHLDSWAQEWASVGRKLAGSSIQY